MKMTKKDFFDSINNIITDEIYLTESLDNLSKEIETNHWSIGIDSETANLMDCIDLTDYFRKVVSNRIEQLDKSGKNLELIFYIWYDEQAGNLNFNLINAKHINLPFSAKLEFVDSFEIILNDFLNSKYLDGIPKDELTDDIQTEEDDNNFILKVYKKKLTKSTKAQHMV